MGRRTPPLEVSVEERAALEEITRSERKPLRHVRCAQGLLLAAQGMSNVEIAAACHVSPSTVRTWRRRFAAEGPAGLSRLPAGNVRVETFDPARVPWPMTLGGLYLGVGERAAALWQVEPAAGASLVDLLGDDRVRSAALRYDERARSSHDFLLFLKTTLWHAPGDGAVQLLLDGFRLPFGHQVETWLSHPSRRRIRVYRTPSPEVWTDAVARAERRGAAAVSDAIDGVVMQCVLDSASAVQAAG